MCPIDGPLGFFEFSGLFVAANGHQTNETTTLCYDGFGIGSGAAFSSGSVASLPIETANAYLDACLDPINNNALRGVFALMRFNPHTKAFTVAADPLAHYPIFICGLGDTLIVSNNCYLIEQTVHAMGLALTRSSKLAATSCALGVGLGNRTGFREVVLIPPGQLVTGIGPNWRLVTAAKQPELNTTTYNDLLDLAADRLTDSLSSIVRSGRDQNVHIKLDGGIYSRVLLAAAVGADVSNLKVSHSEHLSSDSAIVCQLAEKYSADLASQTDDNHLDDADEVEAARIQAFRSQGLPNLSQTIPKTTRTKTAFRIQTDRQRMRANSLQHTAPKALFWSRPLIALGKFSSNDPIYGACLAAYWKAGTSTHAKVAVKWAYQITSLFSARHSLFQKQFLRTATNNLIEQMQTANEQTSTLGNDYIQRDSRRRNLGLQLRQNNLLCGSFDPLIDPILASIFNRLLAFQKTEVGFIIDLIDQMGGREMIEVPFTPDVFEGGGGDVLAAKLGVSKKKLMRESAKISTNPVNALSTDVGLDQTEGFHEQRETTKNILPELATLAAALPAGHECWQYFRRDKLLTALNEETMFLNDTAGTTLLSELLQTFIWAASAEKKIGVENLA